MSSGRMVISTIVTSLDIWTVTYRIVRGAVGPGGERTSSIDGEPELLPEVTNTYGIPATAQHRAGVSRGDPILLKTGGQ